MSIANGSFDVVTETNLMAAMRDGTRLAVDIHRPDSDDTFPALLVRTPYDKIQGADRYLPFLPTHGYALVMQDVRGRFASEGVFEHDVNDAWGDLQDGYDSVEWVARQPWCNGKVAVGGLSAPGCAAILLMPTQPPHLAAAYLEVAGGAIDNYLYRWYHGGIFRYRLLQWMLTSMAPNVVAKEVSDPIERDRVLAELALLKVDPQKMLEAFSALPMLPPTIVGHLDLAGLDFWHDYLSNQTRTQYWNNVSIREKVDLIDIPIMHVTGWFDVMLQGTLDMFTSLQADGAPGARGQQRITIGPWAHGPLWMTQVGDLDFTGADLPREEHLVRYLDTTLKGEPTGLADDPPVLIYVMGDNAWRPENEWPLARSQYTKYYLRDGVGGAPIESLNENKLLSPEPPIGDESIDEYDYDPAHPVMTVGGRTYDPVKGGASDHREAERRSLTFTTPPLDDDLEVTGPLKAVIFAESSAPDTDWFVRLTDVHPDGRSMFVAHGLVRARLRDSVEAASLIEPGVVYRYEIDLWATSQVFKCGHCIRVTVASSDFPAYSRNLNTGKNNHTTTDMQVAHQRIHHDRARPSHIVLPIIPRP